jgi:hypothetical protein
MAGNYWRQEDHWGEAEFSDVKPNEHNLRLVAEAELLRQAQRAHEAGRLVAAILGLIAALAVAMYLLWRLG